MAETSSEIGVVHQGLNPQLRLALYFPLLWCNAIPMHRLRKLVEEKLRKRSRSAIEVQECNRGGNALEEIYRF